MIYILWALLNIALFTLFLVICFYATKLIKEKYGLFISCVFVIGLLSFAGNSKKNNDSIDKNSGEIKNGNLSLTVSSPLNQSGINL